MYNSQFIHVYTAQPIGLGIACQTPGGLKGRDSRADRIPPSIGDTPDRINGALCRS